MANPASLCSRGFCSRLKESGAARWREVGSIPIGDSMAETSTDLVTKRLGRAAGKLYHRLVELLELSTPDTPSRAKVRRIIIELLCGAYHDYRSEATIPKGDLVIALRELAPEPPDKMAILALKLIGDVLGGEFDEDDDEGKRWAAHIVAQKTKHRSLTVPILHPETGVSVADLTPRQREVFAWLCRYHEVYQRPPTIRELADGCSMSPARASQILEALQAKHVVTSLGGSRGWIPTKQP